MKASVLAVLVVMSAANASAMVRVSPIPRSNPLAGLPTLLPSPLNGPLSGYGVILPAPALTPTVTLSPLVSAPRLTVLAAPAAIAAPEVLPSVGMDAGRENVRNPFTALLPDSVLRFAPAADSAKPAPVKAADDDLRGLFDGSRDPRSGAWEPILPRERVPQSRRHGLPEDELESELGFGRDLN